MSLQFFPVTQRERAAIWLQTFLNNTSKVSKISDQSVLDAYAQATAKISNKSEKDIALALAQLFPDNSYGTQLDLCAELFGISPRFGASSSSTYLRLVATPGTTFLANTHIFNSIDGVQFALENDITTSIFGFDYVKVRSLDTGAKTNLAAGRINSVNPQPSGFQYVVNEYICTGGRDIEDDDTFRQRIKGGSNILATNTLGQIEQEFMIINPNVLRVFYQGHDAKGRIKLAIATQNGIDLNPSELDDLLTAGSEIFGLSQMKVFGSQSYGIVLSNISWQPIDISFRCSIFNNFNVDDVRKNCQVALTKYLDFRTWIPGVMSVDFVNLIEICRTTPGMKSVPDNTFTPSVDVQTNKNMLPRLRGFLMLDLNGNLISGSSNQFNPVFYPANLNEAFITTVASSVK